MSDLVDGSDFAQAAAGVRGFDALAGDVLADSLDDAGLIVRDKVRARRARHRVTGRGERMVKVRASGSGAARVVRVHAAGRVAHLLTGGTAPHRIRAMRRDALAFGAGITRFAETVRHPGTRADPFVSRGVDDATAALQRITDDAAGELAAGLASEIGGR